MKNFFLVLSLMLYLDCVAMMQSQTHTEDTVTETKLSKTQKRRKRRQLAAQGLQNHQATPNSQENRKKQQKCKDRGVVFSSSGSGSKNQSVNNQMIAWYLSEEQSKQSGRKRTSAYQILCDQQKIFTSDN